MRKRKRGSEDQSYDSILDTMTNVVGILIIVAAVTQVTVTSAVDRVSGEMPEYGFEITDEVLAEAMDQHAVILGTLTGLRSRWGVLKGESTNAPTDLVRLNESIETLRSELEESTEFTARADSLKKDRDELERQIALLEETKKLAEQEHADLSSQVSTPLPKPAATISLPDLDSKSVEDMTRKRFYCRGGKIYYFPGDELYASIEVGWDKFVERVESGKKFETWKGALRTLTGYIDSAKPGTPDFSVTTEIKDVYAAEFERVGNIRVSYKLKPSAKSRGATLADIHTRSGTVCDMIKKIDTETEWVYFIVYDDSFDIYLAARKLATSLGIKVGWFPHGIDSEFAYYYFSTGGVTYDVGPQ